MSHLAFYASPIDFAKNEKVEQKRKDAKTTKLNLDILKKLSSEGNQIIFTEFLTSV